MAPVGGQPGSHVFLPDAGADHDNAAVVIHVFESRLGRDHQATEVEVDHLIHLFERGLLERLGDGGACVVHEDIEPAEGGDGLFDGGVDGFGVGCVCLDGECFSAIAFDCFDHCGSCIDVLRVGDGHACSIGGQTLRDRRADSPGTAGNKCHFIG